MTKRKRMTVKEKKERAMKKEQNKNYEILEVEGLAGAIRILGNANLWGNFRDIVYGLIDRYEAGFGLSESQQEVLFAAARRQPYGAPRKLPEKLSTETSADPGVVFSLEKF